MSGLSTNRVPLENTTYACTQFNCCLAQQFNQWLVQPIFRSIDNSAQLTSARTTCLCLFYFGFSLQSPQYQNNCIADNQQQPLTFYCWSNEPSFVNHLDGRYKIDFQYLNKYTRKVQGHWTISADNQHIVHPSFLLHLAHFVVKMAPSSQSQPQGMASCSATGKSEHVQPPNSIHSPASNNKSNQDSSTPKETATSNSNNTSRPQSLCENSEAETGTHTPRDPNNTDTEPTDAEGENEDMPKGRPPHLMRREADITTILNTVQQRGDLDKLINGVFLRIETQINKPYNFLNHPVAQTNRVQIWDFTAAYAEARRKIAARKAAEAAAVNGTSTKTTDEEIPEDAVPQIKDEDKIRIDVKSVKPHVSTMNTMKEENISYFQKWKSVTLKRVSDMVVFPHQQSSGSGASRQSSNNQQQQGMSSASQSPPMPYYLSETDAKRWQ